MTRPSLRGTLFVYEASGVQKKLPTLLKRYDIKRAGVFGSRARGTAKRTSDLDLLVSFRHPKTKSLLDLVRIERELSRACGVRVDLITESSLSPYLKKQVLKDLVPVI